MCIHYILQRKRPLKLPASGYGKAGDVDIHTHTLCAHIVGRYIWATTEVKQRVVSGN